uniref:Chromosome 4 C11orf16 homolog n=1 Tax=Xenopus tropicalis TaxID=8364 RepID=A0A803JRP2_XENTR
MDHCTRLLCSDHKYCSVGSMLGSHFCRSLVGLPEPVCGCPIPPHPWVTHHSVPHRYLCSSHYPCVSHVSCKKVEVPSVTPCLPSLTAHETVLARRNHDGFYYLGAIKQEEELGVFLVEFGSPCAEEERVQSRLQKTQAADILQYYEALRHSVLPGDNVLAPWEPELVRYGPGTVTLGLETRDPLRACEDEELTVRFWNGKKTKVPLGVSVWISPAAYRRVLELLHHPISTTGRFQVRDPNSTTYVITDRYTTVPVPVCLAGHHYQNKCHPRTTHRHCSCCCFPTCASCTCCHDPRCQDWWPLSPTSTIYVNSQKEQEDDGRTYRTRSESPKRRETSHYSVSSEDELDANDDDDDDDDDEEEESDNETWLSKTTQTTMVDSGVNTDSSLWDKPRPGISERPEWRYWKHNQPEPFYRKPGSRVSIQGTDKPDPRAPLSEPVGLANQSALFDTISDSPAKRLTVRDLLVHKDFTPSYRPQAPPLLQSLGKTEQEKLSRQQSDLQRKQEKKIQHREWEQNREERAEQKYSDSHEIHRKKTLQRLYNEELKMKEKEKREGESRKAKMEVREQKERRFETLAAEEKQREKRRLDHLRHVREKIDQKEFEKFAANELKETEFTVS